MFNSHLFYYDVFLISRLSHRLWFTIRYIHEKEKGTSKLTYSRKVNHEAKVITLYRGHERSNLQDYVINEVADKYT